MATFDDLGAPFPLFRGDIKDASDFVGRGVCTVCEREAPVRFGLGIGAALMVKCSGCGSENGLDADDRCAVSCGNCGAEVQFPTDDEDITVCYECLRGGKAAITKDTELGMISWEQAAEGMTHGIPGLQRADFEMVPTDSDWVRAKVPQEDMYELLRTPTYLTIQGEQWQFCCKRPMIFIGQWSREDFSANAADGDGEALLNKIIRDVVPGLWEDALHDETGIYVFRCARCSGLRGHWDLA